VKRHLKFEIIESELGDKDVRNFIISFDRVRLLGFDCEISIDEGILVKLYRFYYSATIWMKRPSIWMKRGGRVGR
jgi:hypothetical protein